MKNRHLNTSGKHSLQHAGPSGPGTRLPVRATFVALCLVLAGLLGMLTVTTAFAQGINAEMAQPDTSDVWLDLGVTNDLVKFERNLTKDQIRTFIPPLLRGFTPLHAFVLPPKTFIVELSNRNAKLGGDDFFQYRESNINVFGSFSVERMFVDLGIFYGFDLGRKYLHSFTAFVNIPYLVSRTDGGVHPNGVQDIEIMNRAGTQELGDISLIIKKKIYDQANFPFGLALMGGVYFPTGANDEKFGEDGVVAARMPMMNGAPPVDMPLPLSMMDMMPEVVAGFPFNDGVFNRFGDDGRLASVLQPGDGGFSFAAGGAITRQFLPGDLPVFDRAALHLGMMHRFRRSYDGVDPGDVNTHQVAFVTPIWADYLALEVGYLGFYQFEDHYDGTFITPFFTDSRGNNVNSGATHVTFKEIDRPPFTRGEWGNIASSLIVAPDPQLRFVGTGLVRVVTPSLGPAPQFVLRIGMEALF